MAIDPALTGSYKVTLADGSVHEVKPVWEHFKARCAEYAPDKASVITHIPAEQIEEAAVTYATRLRPETGYGNGGIGYMLAIEHGCNAIQNSRALDALVGITGNWDTPGGNRGGTTSFLTPVQVNFAGNTNMGGAPIRTRQRWTSSAGIDKFPVLKWWQYWADANAATSRCRRATPTRSWPASLSPVTS